MWPHPSGLTSRTMKPVRRGSQDMTEELAPETGSVDHFATNVSVSSDDISDLAGGGITLVPGLFCLNL